MPVPIIPDGFPSYYLKRGIDYLHRSSPIPFTSEIPTWEDIDRISKSGVLITEPLRYYLDSSLICARFSRYSNQLSPGGKVWASSVAKTLQQQNETRLAADPEAFMKLENNPNQFFDAICSDHFVAYTKYFQNLDLVDLAKIPFIPFFRFFLNRKNLRTAVQVSVNTLPRISDCLHRRNRESSYIIYYPVEQIEELPYYVNSPFYFHARINNCIRGGRVNYPYYYELAASVANGFIGIFPRLSESGKNWVRNNQRMLISGIEACIRRDPVEFVKYEEDREVNADMLKKHRQIYENSGFNSLNWADIGLISKTILSSIQPETVANLGEAAFIELMTIISLFKKKISTHK